MGCVFCETTGGEELYRTDLFRVILPEEPDYPGFVRLVLNDHRSEMTELSSTDRQAVMEAIWKVEACLRDIMVPEKVNVASLGNMTPHIHWHVVPRYRDDPHFPGSVWSERLREVEPQSQLERRQRTSALRAAIAERLG